MNEIIKTLLRTNLIFILLMLVIRLLGKREVGQLSVFDLVIILIIADIGAMGIDHKKQFVPSILCLFLLLGLQKVFSLLLLHISCLRQIVDGKPKIMVYNGKINYKEFKKENYTIDDLLNQLHTEGIMDIDEVRLAFLETSGRLSVFAKNMYDEIVLPVVISGKADKDMLKFLNMSEHKLNSLLNDEQTTVKNVLYCSSNGEKLTNLILSPKASKHK